MSVVWVLLGIAVMGGLVMVAFWYVPAYRAWRGERSVICPGTPKEGRVQVDQLRFALTSLSEKPEVRVKSCSRWPEEADCESRCYPQLDVGRDGFPRPQKPG